MLIDNGSTNNFIQDNMVEFLGLEVEQIDPFNVCVGNGDAIPCCGVCRRVPLFMQNVTIVEDIFVLKMEGANIVLGCQWLEKLGPITMDLKKLTMEFMGPRGKIRFKGDHHLIEDSISGSSLRSLFSKGHVSYFYKLQIEVDGPAHEQSIPEIIQSTLVQHNILFS